MASMRLLQGPAAGLFSRTGSRIGSTLLITARRAQSQGVRRSSAQPPAGCAPCSTVASAASKRELLLTSLLLGLSMPAAAIAAGSDADDGYSTAPNGLQWKDMQEGTGAAPVKGALIRCHYTGRLASNGRVFDSSYERGRPLTFKIGAGEVIMGWDIGILGDGDTIPPMKEGGKRSLRIPADLAYGSHGAGGVIPPNATLLFEVELLSKRR